MLRRFHLSAACTLLFFFWGCGGDPSQTTVQQTFNLWNEYADLCSNIKDEPTAKYYVDVKLPRIKEQWEKGLAPKLRDMLKSMSRSEKEALFTHVDKDWDSEGPATMNRLTREPERLTSLVSKIVKDEKERRLEARQRGEDLGDPAAATAAKLCPSILEVAKFRDSLSYDFNYFAPAPKVSFDPDAPKEVPRKLTWGFPKPKGKEKEH